MNFRTLDLNLLRVFAAVMLERNVTRAAAQLAMTQPAVSNALRRLREATGDELFVTVPSGVVPTPHAAGMWPHVEAALERLRHTLDPQGFDPTRDPRSFALAMADATATVVMPAFVDTLLRERALADMRVLPLSSRDPRPLLEQGIADVAVGFFPDVAAALASEGAQATIALNPLYTCEYVVVMRRGHALTAHLLLLLDDSSPNALAVDVRPSPSAARLAAVSALIFTSTDGGVGLSRLPGRMIRLGNFTGNFSSS